MTTTTKLLVAGVLGYAAWRAYRHYKAQRLGDAPSGAAASAPGELEMGGVPYGTTATTDVQKATTSRTFVPAPERYPSRGELALMGIHS